MRALSAPGIAADRELTRHALRVSPIKDRRDEGVFDRIFDLFFRLRPVLDADPAAHGHAHDDLSDEGSLDRFSLSEDPGDTPQEGHSHGKPADIRQYFDDEDMAARYNLHQEANRIDMASLTDEIVLSNETSADTAGPAARVQLTTSRLHNPGRPGDLSTHDGMRGHLEALMSGHLRTIDAAQLRRLGAGSGWDYQVHDHHGGWLVLDRPAHSPRPPARAPNRP